MRAVSGTVETRFRPPLELVVLLGALTAFAPLSVDIYLPSLPAMGQALGTSTARAALTVVTFFVGLAVGQLVHGPLSDRIGRRPPLIAGTLLYVLASIGCASAQSVEVLIALRFLQAFGGCSAVVIARAVVRDRFAPHETAHVYSMLMLVMGLAPVLGPLLGGFILLVAGWRTIFWVLTGFGLAAGLGAFFRLRESRSAATAARARAESPWRSYLAVARDPRIMGYVFCGAFSQAALLTYVTISPSLVIGTFHVPPEHFGWVFGTNGIGLVVVSQLNRRLLHLWDYDTILRWANVLGLAFGLMLLATGLTGFGGLWGLTVPLFLIVANMGLTQANALAGAMAVDPSRAGTTSALAGCGQFAAGALCGAVASAVNDGTTVPFAAVILGALAIAGLGLRVLVRPPSA